MDFFNWETLLSLADKNKLTQQTKKLLDLPDTAQDHYNQYSMVNYAPFYTPVLDTLQPKVIVEIGSEAGNNTDYLARLAKKYGAEFYIVDTHPAYDKRLEKEPSIHYKKMKSSDFLNNFNQGDVFFIDGDHNYATLYEELKKIDEIRKNDPILMFVHDTLWPCGLRDLYYDVTTLDSEPLDYSKTKGPVLWDEALQPDGHFAYDNTVAVALNEGGPNNGLMTAVQDFLYNHDEYESFSIPCFYGLTVIWKKSGLTGELRSLLDFNKNVYNTVRPVLSTLEWNRLIHIYIQEKFLKSHAELQACMYEINALKEAIFQETRRADTLSGRNSFLNKENNRLKALIKEIYSSRSWKLTKPVRFFGRIIRKILGKE